MSLADRIREFVYKKYVRPTLEAGKSEIQVRAGDVHRDMRLQNRMPAVCSALGVRVFESAYGLVKTGRSGPPQGANAVFFFHRSGQISPAPETALSE